MGRGVPRQSVEAAGVRGGSMGVYLGYTRTIPKVTLAAVLCACCSCGMRPGSGAASLPGAKPKSTTEAAFLGKFQDLTEIRGTTFQVVYTPETITFAPAEAIKSIRSISHDGQVYVFDPSAEQVQKIKVGSVLFLKNLTVRKVTAVASDRSGLAVATDTAAITDLIKDGHMKWNAPLHFGEAQAHQRAALVPKKPMFWSLTAKNWLLPVAVVLAGYPLNALDGEEQQQEEEDGWMFKQNTSVVGNRLNIHMTLDNPDVASKSGGKMTMHIAGEGYLQDFDTSAGLDIQGGAVEHFQYTWKNLNGVVNFHWDAGTDAPGPVTGEERFTLPAAFEVPFPVGGIPFMLAVGEAILIKPGFSGNHQIAEGDFHIDYNGTTGLSVGNGSLDEEGGVHGQFGIVNGKSLSPIGALGMVVALALPRLELKLGAENPFEILHDAVPSFADKVADELEETLFSTKVKKIVKTVLKTEGSATFQIIISTSAFATGNLVAFSCQRTQMIVTGNISAGANLLGATVGEMKPKEVFRKEFEIGTEGGPCKVAPNEESGTP
jgi:hypothetical protein